ncbi:MAG: hypothetical protein LQ337_006206 [Flavoplaca oasis]|nr:MAG: hypothetical protein LQ337_006206 [Flavoplaca oasis]
MIVKETTKKDQKSLRLSSRYFNEFIPSDLMQNIISQTDRVSNHYWPAPTHFGYLVTTLTLQAVDYEELHCREWGAELKERWHGHYMTDKLLYNDSQHRRQACRIYRRCRQKLQNDTLRFLALLGDFLQYMPNLEHIRITDAAYGIREEPYANSQCQIRGCPFQGEGVHQDHTVFALPPTSGLKTLGSIILDRLMLGLSRMQRHLPTLTIASTQDEHWTGLHIRTLVSSPAPINTQLPHFVGVISNLTGLTLQLRYDDYAQRDSWNGPQINDVSRILVNATNLESLNLSVEPDNEDLESSPADFRPILGGCVFHQLKSLTLSGLQSTPGELLGFTDHSSRLVRLDFRSHELLLGNWGPVLEHWKLHLQSLRYVELADLSEIWRPGLRWGEFVCRSCDDDYDPVESGESAYTDLQNNIRRFFFSDGSNPFSD